MSVTDVRVFAPPEVEDTEVFQSGIYVTDGWRLFRVLSPGQSLFPSAELEDCHTLEVDRYYADELFAMRLYRVDH